MVASSAASSAIGRLLRRYPVTSGGLAAGVSLWSYAEYVEFQADRQSLKFENQPPSSVAACEASSTAISSSSSDGSDGTLTLPRTYDRDAIEQYWSHRPITVSRRLCQITTELSPLFLSILVDWKVRRTLLQCVDGAPLSGEALQHRHASQLREALTRLGPAFVKAGQQLSIRPDLAPPVVLSELGRLCDSVQPVEDEVAFGVLREELLGGEDRGDGDGSSIEDVFEGIHLVASASLGQVYKAKLRSTGQNVAIKIQRPDMVRSVSLDMFLLNKVARLADVISATCTEQAPFHEGLVDTFARGSYMELDYENEASNQNHFKTELQRRKCKVHVPTVYSQYTTQRVLTTEWIDGVKLADAPQDLVRDLIPVGVELFLTQLLDVGRFHADPHPGNLFVTGDGRLCLLDFGLCAEVDEHSRRAMTAAIVHILTGDFDALISKDAKTLGFLPTDLDTRELQPILTKILTEGMLESGSDLRTRRRKLMEISNELNEVFFKYPFSVPPFFALVTRGLGLLEGIALSGDPTFDIFRASYPYARRRAMEIFGTHSLNRVRDRMTSGGGAPASI